jgi:hypothetical protein
MLHFVFTGFAWFSLWTAIISLHNINQLIFVMVTGCVLFEVRAEFLNNIYTTFVIKELNPLMLGPIVSTITTEDDYQLYK